MYHWKLFAAVQPQLKSLVIVFQRHSQRYAILFLDEYDGKLWWKNQVGGIDDVDLLDRWLEFPHIWKGFQKTGDK